MIFRGDEFFELVFSKPSFQKGTVGSYLVTFDSHAPQDGADGIRDSRPQVVRIPPVISVNDNHVWTIHGELSLSCGTSGEHFTVHQSPLTFRWLMDSTSLLLHQSSSLQSISKMRRSPKPARAPSALSKLLHANHQARNEITNGNKPGAVPGVARATYQG